MRMLMTLGVCFASALSVSGTSTAGVIRYETDLSGPNESPPNASPATGFALVTVDSLLDTLRVEASFSGLIGTSTIAHIHAPTAMPGQGVAAVATTIPTFPDFPVGVTSGSYDMSFDLLANTTYSPGFLTANGGSLLTARDALLSSLATGRSYFNLHTTSFPAGEIRGFLQEQTVPEPGTLAIFLVAAIGMLISAKKALKANGRVGTVDGAACQSFE